MPPTPSRPPNLQHERPPQRVHVTHDLSKDVLARLDRLLKYLESASDTAALQKQIDAITAQLKRQNDALEAFVASVPKPKP